jgi:hypothetical protein
VLVMEHDHLIAMLNRLKLTAIRDHLDSLIEEAGRAGRSQERTRAILHGFDFPDKPPLCVAGCLPRS